MRSVLVSILVMAVLAIHLPGCRQYRRLRHHRPAVSPVTVPRRQGGYLPDPMRFQSIADGKLIGSSNGRRIAIEGGITRVIDSTSSTDLGTPYAIPVALGGGFLFVTKAAVRFAPSFESTPTLVAVCPSGGFDEYPPILGIGHSSVYLAGCESDHRRLAILPTGEPTDPPLPGLAEILAIPSGMVAARTEHGRVYLSGSAGAPWKPLATPRADALELLRYDNGSEKGSPRRRSPWRLSLRRDNGERTISVGGQLEEVPADAGRETTTDALGPFGFESHRDGANPLMDFFANLMAPGKGVLRDDEDLVFFDAWSGVTTQRRAQAFTGPNCYFRRAGTPSLIVCPGPNLAVPKSDVFRIASWGGSMELVASLPAFSHQIPDASPGHALVYPGRCNGEGRKGIFCVFVGDQAWREFSLPPKLLRRLLDVQPPRVFWASHDARHVFAISQASNQDWVLMDAAKGRLHRLPKGAIPSWAERFDCATLGRDSLRVLIEGGTLGEVDPGKLPDAGIVEIGFDGTVKATHLAGQLRCFASRALHLLADGTMRETLDAGRTFHRVEPPPGGASQLDRCRDPGCTIHSFFRVGWGRD
jgi:hypothetical protein